MQPFPVHRHFQLVQFFVISNNPVGGRLILLQKAGGGQIKSALRLIGHLEQMRIQGGKGGVKLPQGVRVVIHDSEYWLDDWIRFCRHDKKMLPAQAVLSGGAGSQPSSRAGNMGNTPGSILEIFFEKS